MITLLTGENNFELTRALDAIVAGFDGAAEKFDGSELELNRLPDLLLGGTLFADKRLVIVRDLSDNKPLWEALPDWTSRMDDAVHLVLVEPKPDKRTKTYKDIKARADVREFAVWSERDMMAAEAWVVAEAKRQGMTWDRKTAGYLVERVGLDQWQLFHALEKLVVLGDVTPELINKYIEASPSENIFNLLDAALGGQTARVHDMIQTLERAQDPYMTFGLLAGQTFQLAVLAVATGPTNQVAADIGAHPYALGKLAPHAKRLGRSGTRNIIRIFADTDTLMKSIGADPWLLVEDALIKTASL